MQPLFLDFETYYDDEYSLRKMTPIEYILDPRFESLGCGFIYPDGSPLWVDGPSLDQHFKTIDWANLMVISHNALFDMLILSFRYGIVPKMYGDTLSMARNWLSPSLSSLSLASVAEHYGMPPKWGTVNKLKGIGFAALQQDQALYWETCGYALDDTIKCKEIFTRILADGFPPNELRVIDMVIRMATCPQLTLDEELLAHHLAYVRAQKQQLLDNAYLEDKSSVMSDPQLQIKFLFLGVDPIPMKVSKTTGKEVCAFAKTDKEFTALLEHENPMVQALVAARLGHKSTLEETRTERLQKIARLAPLVPVPLKYSGAHTHRFSGDWKINLQNLPRGGEIRRAIRAPKGKMIVSVDASQIEARLNATLSGEQFLMDAFRKGEDVYAWFAEKIYGYPVTKREQPVERFVGKTGILSLGYGSSWPVFQSMCRNVGDVTLTDRDASEIVGLYRSLMTRTVNNWHYAGDVVLPQIAGRNIALVAGTAANETLTWGPLELVRQAIVLPNGNRLRYRDLHQDLVDGKWQWVYWRGKMMQKIYGAKVVENGIQALAFVHLMEVALRVLDITNGLLWPAHQIHDELLYVVDEKLAEMVQQLVIIEMSKSPSWMPDAPLAAEGKISVAYHPEQR